MVISIFVLLGELGYSQSVFTVPFTEKIPVMDGVVNEIEWTKSNQIQFSPHRPVMYGKLNDTSEVFIMHNQKYLYIGAVLHYQSIDDIRTTGSRRDDLGDNGDFFGVVLDSFKDNENGVVFITNANGIRSDATIFNDALGDTPYNLTWNTFWSVTTTKDSSSWSVEMRIPFSSLKFNDESGVVKMGLSCWRSIASKAEIQTFPKMSNQFGPWSHWKPSTTQVIELRNVFSRKSFQLSPYVLGGIEGEAILNEQDNEYLKVRNTKLNFGLNAKYNISKNFTVDLTVNPDFSQVTADNEQVNFSRSPLFFPEQRPFFLERSGVFEFRLGGPNRLFYSRRIGINETSVNRIYAGVRLIGRKGPWDIGVLNMHSENKASSGQINYSVIRVRRRVLNKNSFLGSMVTNQLKSDGTYNTGLGLDGVIRIFGNDYLEMAAAETFSNESGKSLVDIEQSKYRLKLGRRKNKGFGYDFGWVRVGENYNPEMGFEFRENYSRYGDALKWTWIGAENSPFTNHQAFVNASAIVDNPSKKVQSADMALGWQFNSKKGAFGEVTITRQIENLSDTLIITSDLFVPESSTIQYLTSLKYNSNNQRTLSFESSIEFGQFYDGDKIEIQFSPTWVASPWTSFSADYLFNRVIFSVRDQLLNAHIFRLKNSLALSKSISVLSYAQLNSVSKTSLVNLRLRYNPREGNDLYLVFNMNINYRRNRQIPELPYYNTQAILIKYSHTFVL